MLFNSFAFILGFFPACYLVFWYLRSRQSKLAIPFLFLASYVFYVFGESHYPYIIALSIAVNFFFGDRIRRAAGAAGGRRWLAGGICFNLALLVVFKYANFLAGILTQAGAIKAVSWHIELPIGISFFTFTQIAYLVDVRSGKATEYDPVSYALFVTFFPHLIAGPILHHSEMMPQFARKEPGRPLLSLGAGLPIFAIGLFKKTVIADSVAPTVNLLFAQAHDGSTIGFLAAWCAALSYTVQIYFDFSGYSDMAIGLARMLGIDLPVNFNSPYKAASISDFWRRWHITLSRFLRDYLYIALGGNRYGIARRYLNLFLTMVLGGLWHGAGWTFLFWGFLHGIYLVLGHLWSAASSRIGVVTPAFVGRTVTMLLVVIAWVSFRAPDLATAAVIWKGMIGLGGFSLPSSWAGAPWLAHRLGIPMLDFGVNGSSVLVIAASLVACFVLPNSQQIMSGVKVGLDSPGYSALPKSPIGGPLRLRANLYWAVVIGIVLGLGVRTIGDYSAFIYFQF